MPAKNAREKDGFRDICDDCYPIIMGEKGYTLVNGIWYSKHSRPTQRAVELPCTCAKFENGSKVFPMRECDGCRKSASR